MKDAARPAFSVANPLATNSFASHANIPVALIKPNPSEVMGLDVKGSLTIAITKKLAATFDAPNHSGLIIEFTEPPNFLPARNEKPEHMPPRRAITTPAE